VKILSKRLIHSRIGVEHEGNTLQNPMAYVFVSLEISFCH
jgi:hypothetical protein